MTVIHGPWDITRKAHVQLMNAHIPVNETLAYEEDRWHRWCDRYEVDEQTRADGIAELNKDAEWRHWAKRSMFDLHEFVSQEA
jgi:hypothetical protein